METLAQFGPGTLFAGLAALLQLTLWPGLLLQRGLQHTTLAQQLRSVPAVDLILLVFVASAVLSFQGVFLLQLGGVHIKSVWAVLATLQVLALFYWRAPIAEAATAAPSRRALPLSSLLSLLVFLFCFIQLLVIVLGNFPGVLDGWDAVVSWNRWAHDWQRGDWPYLTWSYPQLVPALWSLVYLWQDSGEVEFIVRLWMGLFPLALALVFLAVFVHWRRWSLLLAGAAMISLLLGPYLSVLDTGYVDVPVTLATLLTGHWVILARHDREQAALWLLFAAFATALALLSKQSGILALGVFVYGCWCSGWRTRAWRLPLLLLVLLALPWHIVAAWYERGDSVLAYVTGDIYGNETLPERMSRALTLTLPSVLGIGTNYTRNSILAMVGIAGLLLALRDRQGRFHVVIGFAYLLIWAAFFSYDGRNLLPGLPFVLLAIANGYGWMPLPSPWMEESFQPIGGWPRGLNLQRSVAWAGALVLLAGLLPANPARWERYTNELRKLTGDAEFNSKLVEAANAAQATGAVYTTYTPLVAINELRPYWFNDYGASHMLPATAAALNAGAPVCDTLATIPEHKTIRYLLLHTWIFPAVIEPALANGTLQTLLTGKDLRLMQVLCPSTGVVQ